MLLILHLSIAFASIVTSSLLVLQPSRNKLFASYGLVGGTLVSGTILTLTTHSSLAHTCATGLVYLGSVTIVIAGGRYRLAKAYSANSKT